MREGIKRKSMVAIEETADVSNKKSTGNDRDNSNCTGENDVDIIQVEDITMEGEQDGESEKIIFRNLE